MVDRVEMISWNLYYNLLRRAKRRLSRGRRPGPEYLYRAYWDAIAHPSPETVAALREAVRKAHA